MIFLLLFLILFSCPSYAATLTAGYTPVTAVGGSTPELQNASIYDTGTTSGTGNVGIASTNPGESLDVQGTIRSTAFVLSGNNASAGYILQTSSSTGIGTWVPEPSSGGSGTVNSGTLNQFAFYSITGTAVNGTTNLIQDNNGNIGVSVASPGVKFDVNGSIRGTQVVDSGVTSAVVVANASHQLVAASNLTDTAYSTQTFGTLTNPDWCTTNGTSISCTQPSPGTVNSGTLNQFAFYSATAAAVNGTSNLIQNNSGNIGISSANPGNVLDVQGTIRGLGLVSTVLLNGTEYNIGTCTTAATINPINGVRQKVTLTNGDTCALTFTQPVSGTAVVSVKIIQSTSSSYNGIISGCKWPSGTAMTPTATTGAIDYMSVYFDGSNAYCVSSGQAYS